ncbi:MAG: preprotein translocase subunit SecG [Deltaproteobacteria bacterium CG11_big_fil_rev_8_21_14_0_20_47_16]|nr:MAG: preprotein translocase subunit SecG [Deltaproteobacteria bacterium CG11_big_fil_rev_8_21_14_0_20_47_16]
METIVTVIHYIVCTFMIGAILMQAGKGADIGAAFGSGGSQTVFGARGPATFLNKITIGAAIIFLFTSLTLAQLAKKESVSSVVDSAAPVSAPAQAGATDTAPDATDNSATQQAAPTDGSAKPATQNAAPAEKK